MKFFPNYSVKLMIAAIIAWVILGISCGSPTPPAKPTPTVSVPVCDVTLWRHVYHPQRLKILDDCLEVAGYVLSVRQEPDGDAHIMIYLDVPLDGNITLVTEAICVYPVQQADAVQACVGFHNRVSIPPIESHVVVVGTHVLDTNHGWEEIHPITSLEVL